LSVASLYEENEILLEPHRVFACDIRDGRFRTVRAILNLDKLRHLDHALGGDIR
jgi:hypothetical protein